MTDVSTQSPEFMDFVFIGLDHGIYSISDNGGPLIPFVMTKHGEEKKLQRFVTEKYEDGITAAENYIKSLVTKPDFALIAFDGYLTWEDKKYDAIYVRSFDKLQHEGFTFSQRYIPKIDGQGTEPIGNSSFLGNELNLLLTPTTQTTNTETEKQKRPWWKFGS